MTSFLNSTGTSAQQGPDEEEAGPFLPADPAASIVGGDAYFFQSTHSGIGQKKVIKVAPGAGQQVKKHHVVVSRMHGRTTTFGDT